MEMRFNVGDAVRTRRKIKNDGTFPGLPWDALLLDKGEEGVVMDIGTFLLTKTVYTVYFPRLNIFVGCLEELKEEVKKLRMMAINTATKLHDLAEEGLPEKWEEIPKVAEEAYRVHRSYYTAKRILEERTKS